MNIDTVALQVKTLCPLFGNSVAGAAAYADGVKDQAWLPLPAAYVLPGGMDAEDNSTLTGLTQIVHERVIIIVVLDTLMAGGTLDISDRRGQAAAASLTTIGYALYSAVLNWRPDWTAANPSANREARGMYLLSAGYPEGRAFDRARFFYQWVFGLDTTLTDADGWQISGDPLTDALSTVNVDYPANEAIPIIFDTNVGD